jgi:N-acetylmuramoyl-L-alanine amidase
MQWSSLSSRLSKPLIALVVTILSVSLAWKYPLASAEEKRLTVYAPQTTYTLQVSDHENREYAGVYELLQPLGKVQVRVTGAGYSIRMGEVDGEFQEGRSKIRVGHSDITFPGKVVIEQGRVLLPIRALPAVLSQYLKLHADLHEPARRLFIENAATRFSAELKKADGSLVISFPKPVNPNVSTEGSKIHLLFARDPVVFGADGFTYNDKLVSSINFVEHNGVAEIVVNGTTPLLATFSDGGRTIAISAAPSPTVAQSPTPTPALVVAQPAPTPESTSSASATSAPGTSPPAAALASHGLPANSVVHFFVMIDAGHGGAETGTRFSDKLSEKEITLLLARRLRTELQNRGVNAVLLRDGDTTLTFDQRAVASNAQRAGLYISIHAGGPGTGVRVYTALMPTPEQSKGEKLGPFLPWGTAQAGFLERSRLVAASVVAEMGNKDVNALMTTAPVPPLNSIAAPAFAMEVAPPKSDATPDSLFTPSYQQAIAVATATAIVNARPKIEEQR